MKMLNNYIDSLMEEYSSILVKDTNELMGYVKNEQYELAHILKNKIYTNIDLMATQLVALFPNMEYQESYDALEEQFHYVVDKIREYNKKEGF